MLRIAPTHIEAVERAAAPADLIESMQQAMKLEHATIPVYLTGMMSLKPGMNREIHDIIHSVVIEEMLHFSIACNIINALDGAPGVNVKDYIPTFPGPLPLGIGGLTVGLEALSRTVVHDTYMEIEEPEDPLRFPVRTLAAELPDEEFRTIGEFYAAVAKRIKELVPGQMPGHPERQMTAVFDRDELFPISTSDDAVAAIGVIVRQGEGTSKSPLDPEGKLAHYYRFAEIYHGKRLVPDPSVPAGFSYSGEPIPLDPDGVFDLVANTRLRDLPGGSEAANKAREFAGAYSRLLNALDETFNGHPERIDDAMGMMFDVTLTGSELCAMPFPGRAGQYVGPTFEYLPG